MTYPLYLAETLIFLASALVVVSLVRQVKTSPILGYLLVGALIGPYAFGFIPDSDAIRVLGEYGVVFLLFAIGLELPLQRLQVLRYYVFGLGLSQVLLTTALFTGAAMLFNINFNSAFLVGGAMALSSTAVVLQVLSERGEVSARYGRVAFAILLFQDLAVVLFLMLLSRMSASPLDPASSLGWAALKAGFALTLIIALGRLILRPLFRWVAHLHNSELFVVVTLLVVLGTSLATSVAGLSMEMGAFLAGILLSETEYRHQVEADIQPFQGLLLGLFFATVGMSIDFKMILSHGFIIFGLLISMLVVKAVGVIGLCRVFGISLQSSLRTGLMIAGGGEFAFVLLKPLVANNLLDSHIANLLFIVVAFSMALTPFLAQWGKRLSIAYIEHESESHLEAQEEDITTFKDHVIIAGYGRVGQTLAKLLEHSNVPFVVIDHSIAKVNEGRTLGMPVFFGNACKAEIFRTIGADRAKSLVLCLDQAHTLVKAALMARRHFPNLKIHVRLNEPAYEAKLSKAGVEVVVPESLEPSLQLASRVLENVGATKEETAAVIDTFRRDHSRKIFSSQELHSSSPSFPENLPSKAQISHK